MPESPLYPNLVDRALRYIQGRGAADEADLCAHLFGLPRGAAATGPWLKILRDCLESDRRLRRGPDGAWALRSRARDADQPAIEFVSLAIRTDGPKPWRHRVIGIAAIRSGPAGEAVWQSAIRPDRPRRLPGYLSDFGLGPDQIEEAPTFADVADDLLAFVDDRPLVSLDVGLAAAFLQFELRRLGRPSLVNPLIDLAPLAGLVNADPAPGRKPDLARLARANGVPTGDNRRLLARARIAAALARALLDRARAAGLRSLDDLLAALSPSSPGPAGGLEATKRRLLLDASAVREFPESPGVYRFRDAAGETLYVGKATSLRGRLARYFTSDLARDRQMSGIVEATESVQVQPTETELEAQLLEARLIASLRPRFNVQRRAGLPLAYVRRRPEAGRPRVKGEPRRPPWASLVATPGPDSVGPLAPGEARRLLAEASRHFRLRRGRQKRDWAARADEAWRWLAPEVPNTPLVGPLTAGDLRLFALRAPRPSPRLEAEPAAEDDGAVWPAGEETAEGDPAARGEPSVSDPGESGEQDEPLRLVVLGPAGWLGSLTLAPDAAEAEVAKQVKALAGEARPPNPTALVELGVALRWAARMPEAIVRIG